MLSARVVQTNFIHYEANIMNKLITHFAFASALPVAIGITPPPPPPTFLSHLVGRDKPMGQWRNLTANFLSRSCRLILLVLAISTAVPFIFGINTAQAQTEPTITAERLNNNSIQLSWSNILGSPLSIFVTENGRDRRLPTSLFGSVGAFNISTTNQYFNRINNAERVGIAGRSGGSYIGHAYTTVPPQFSPPPTIALAGPDTGVSDRDRITGQRGIVIVLASNFDRGRGDTWGISVDGGADNYFRTRVDNAGAAPHLRFGLGDGKYTDDQVRVRQTIDGVLSAFAGLAAFIFDSTKPVVSLIGAASITLKQDDPYTDLGATASDVLDESITEATTTDTVDTSTADLVGFDCFAWHLVARL